jgi:hypothetical protein
MSIDNPRPAPGTDVVCLPVEEYLALNAELAELYALAAALIARATPEGMPEVAENVCARARRLCERMAALTAAIIVMPRDDKPP